MRVVGAYFSGEDGERRDDLHTDTQQLLAVSHLEEDQAHSANRIRFSFVAEGAQFAHMVLPRLIELEADLPTGDPWRAILSRPTLVRSIGDFGEAAARALEEKVVHHIIRIQPQNMPEFLKRPAGGAEPE